MPRETFNAKSDYVTKALPGAGRAAMIAAAEHAGAGALLCDAYGGVINRIAPGALRSCTDGRCSASRVHGNGATASWIDQAWTKLRPFVSGLAYQNYIDPSLKHWERAYYGQNLERLKATRERVDPHHYFNFPQAIGR